MNPWKLNYIITIIRKRVVHLRCIDLQIEDLYSLMKSLHFMEQFFWLHRSVIFDNRNKRVVDDKRIPKTIIPKVKKWLGLSGEQICVRFLIFVCQQQEYKDNSVSSCYSDVKNTFFENLSNPILDSLSPWNCPYTQCILSL